MAVFWGVAFSSGLAAQLLSNASLSGKYFVRHVQFTTDLNNNATDARSITGSITFDGKGGYQFSGQQVVGVSAPGSYSVNGSYSVAGSGTMTMTNPQKPSVLMTGRFGAEAVFGSTTEAPDNTFDLLVAIPAPPPGSGLTNSALSVSWNLADLELTGGSTVQVRSSGAAVQFDGAERSRALRYRGILRQCRMAPRKNRNTRAPTR